MFLNLFRISVGAVLVLFALGEAALAFPQATEVRLGIHPEKTRFVLELSEKVDFSVFSLADPYRIVVDLPEIDWQVSPPSSGRHGGLIEGLRFGLFKSGHSRIVLDLKEPAAVADAFVLPPKEGYPYRFVLDLKPQSREAFLAVLAPPPSTPSPSPVPLPPSRRRDSFTVVIDPGHGGIDPGAIAISGIYEKEITLAFARSLREALQERSGYRVMLTRDDDVFLRLRERVEVARHAQADLFISLHADSIADTRVRGGGIYTLSETASDDEAEALAAKENRADIIAGVDLQTPDQDVASILIDLTQRETMNYSAQFATALVPQLRREIKMRRKPHRFAGFRVLKAPDVPSVLIELGYLSNRQDESMLRSPAQRKAIAESVAGAIDEFRQSLKR